MATEHEEFLESHARLFNTACWIADDYRIEKGVMCPVMGGKVMSPLLPVKGARFYMPLGRPELPGELSRVTAGAEALAFVKRYGLLGYTKAFGFHELPGAVGHDSSIRTGDPVAWVLAHARTVRLIMELAEALADPDQLKLRIEKLVVRDPSTGSIHLAYSTAYRGFLHPSQCEHRYDDDTRRCALEIIGFTLSQNLEGLHRAVIVEHVGPGLGLTTMFQPRNLLDCIYWLLADAVTAGMVQACAQCHRLFVGHGKMKYCPPLLNQEVSPCMNREKQRRFRLKERARKLRTDGYSIKGIAETIGEDEQQVRTWVGMTKARTRNDNKEEGRIKWTQRKKTPTKSGKKGG